MKEEVEWEEILYIACGAYNFFPNGQSPELAFFLMFDRDIYIPTLAYLLPPKLKYLGDKSSLLSIEILREAFMLAGINFKMAREVNLVRRQKNPKI